MPPESMRLVSALPSTVDLGSHGRDRDISSVRPVPW